MKPKFFSKNKLNTKIKEKVSSFKKKSDLIKANKVKLAEKRKGFSIYHNIYSYPKYNLNKSQVSEIKREGALIIRDMKKVLDKEKFKSSKKNTSNFDIDHKKYKRIRLEIVERLNISSEKKRMMKGLLEIDKTFCSNRKYFDKNIYPASLIEHIFLGINNMKSKNFISNELLEEKDIKKFFDKFSKKSLYFVVDPGDYFVYRKISNNIMNNILGPKYSYVFVNANILSQVYLGHKVKGKFSKGNSPTEKIESILEQASKSGFPVKDVEIAFQKLPRREPVRIAGISKEKNFSYNASDKLVSMHTHPGNNFRNLIPSMSDLKGLYFDNAKTNKLIIPSAENPNQIAGYVFYSCADRKKLGNYLNVSLNTLGNSNKPSFLEFFTDKNYRQAKKISPVFTRVSERTGFSRNDDAAIKELRTIRKEFSNIGIKLKYVPNKKRGFVFTETGFKKKENNLAK